MGEKLPNLQQPINLSLIERVAKSDAHPHGAKHVDKNILHKPTIIAIAALDSIGENDANGMAKRAQMLIGRDDVFADDIQFIGAHQKTRIIMPRAVRYHNEAAKMDQHIYSDGLMQLVEEQLKPLVVDGETGEKIDMEMASRNIRNINFLTHSSGSVILDEIGNALCAVMDKAGYSEAETKRITSQIFALNIAPVASFGRSKASFTTVNVMNLADTIIPEFSDNIAQTQRLITREGSDKNLHILPLCMDRENERIVAVHDVPESTSRSPIYTPKNYKPTNMQLKDTDGHTLTSFINMGTEGNGILLPQIAATALTHAINNSVANQQSEKFIPLDADTLLELPKKLAFKTVVNCQVGGFKSLHEFNRQTGFAETVKSAQPSL